MNTPPITIYSAADFLAFLQENCRQLSDGFLAEIQAGARPECMCQDCSMLYCGEIWIARIMKAEPIPSGAKEPATWHEQATETTRKLFRAGIGFAKLGVVDSLLHALNGYTRGRFVKELTEQGMAEEDAINELRKIDPTMPHSVTLADAGPTRFDPRGRPYSAD